MRTKRDLRNIILDKRNNMISDQVLEKSSKIIDKLTSSEEYKTSKTVFIYMDFKNEVKTLGLINKMLGENKHVVIPYTDVANTIIIPVEIKDVERDLKISQFGYLEPKTENVIQVQPEKFDLIIVPGVVFDYNLNRIGFGKGYYDRILKLKRQNTKAIAIAYEFQVLDEIPFEDHDIKMDMIITEENIYKK